MVNIAIFLLAILVHIILEDYGASCSTNRYYLAKHSTIHGCPIDCILTIQGKQVEVVKRRWQDTMEGATTVGRWDCGDNGTVKFTWEGQEVYGYFSKDGERLYLDTEKERGWQIERISKEEADKLKRKDPLKNKK